MAQYLSKEGADNLSSAIRAYIDSTHSTSLLKIQLGAANGVAPLDSNKLIPSSYLPAYVDDVIEYDDYDSLPSTGVSGKIYVTLDNGKTYRWGGTNYVEISASLAIGNDASTAFAGDRGVKLEGYFDNGVAKQAKKVTSSLTVGSKTYNGSSPIEIVKSDLGLGDVENTALSTWKGTSNITTLGTITTGTWQGTTIAVSKGGTGLVSYTAGDMLYATGATTLAKVASSSFGRSLLGATSGNKFAGLYAEKAEKDSQGNVITSTYMPFSGGTFSGGVTFEESINISPNKQIALIDANKELIGSIFAFNSTNNTFDLAYGAIREGNAYDTKLHGSNIYFLVKGGALAATINDQKDIIAEGNIQSKKGVSAKGIADFGISGGGSATGGAYYSLNSSSNDSSITLNLKSQDGSGDSSVVLPSFSTSRSGIVPKATSGMQILFGSGWGVLSAVHIPDLSWLKITSDKPTTLAGYGITDVKIANGVITLGSNTITPIVSGDLKTLTFAAGSFAVGSYSPTTAKTINIPTTTSHIAEGSNLYFTNARAQAAITGGASTIVTSGLTASRALVSNANGKVAVSDITSTELSYLDGVTSNIQTQLNAKFPTANFTKANIKSTLGISDWALATSKPSYSASDISNLSLSVDTAYDWDTDDDIDAQNYGYSLTVGSKSFAMSAMTKTEVNAIISKYFS